jgi:hypothetical protein
VPRRDPMAGAEEYIINCWHCRSDFNAFDAPFCKHNDPTKICPFCLKCFCDAPETYKNEFIKKSPMALLEDKIQAEEGKDLKLGEMLIKAGKITDDQLKTAIHEQQILNKPLGEIIVMKGFLTKEELGMFLIDQKQIDEINLEKFKIDLSLVKKLGITVCLKYRIIPIEYVEIEKERILRVAAASKEEWYRFKSANLFKDIILIPYLAKKETIDELLENIKIEDFLVIK